MAKGDQLVVPGTPDRKPVPLEVVYDRLAQCFARCDDAERELKAARKALKQAEREFLEASQG